MLHTSVGLHNWNNKGVTKRNTFANMKCTVNHSINSVYQMMIFQLKKLWGFFVFVFLS